MPAQAQQKEFEILSATAVQEMHEKFMNGIKSKAEKAVPEGTENRDEVIDALKGLLIECTRKNIKMSNNDLAEAAKEGVDFIRSFTTDAEGSLHSSLPAYTHYKSPKFSARQILDISSAAKKRTEALPAKELFGKEERIYVRLNGDQSVKSATQENVAVYLDQQGYKIIDYNKGYATDAAGKQQFKIGKLLKNAPELYKAFSEDDSRTLGSLLVVLSRNPEDIARMSTGRAWASCMGSGGFNYPYVPKDIQSGTIVAYLVSEKDPDILNPLSRVLLKPFIRTDKDGGQFFKKIFNHESWAKERKKRRIVFVADKKYGLQNNAFSNLVKDFAEEKLNKGIHGKFSLANGLYPDGIALTIKRSA